MGIINDLVFTGGQQVMNSNIDPNFSASWREGLTFQLTGKTGVPFPSLPADAQGLDAPLDRPVLAHPQPPDPTHPQAPTIQLEPISVLLQSKTIESIAAFEAWVPRSFTPLYPPKERLEGFI